ncbi:Retrotransposable element Tf2 protein [Rhizoctonia solani]|uniref:Retrotransposable element Tf2 protein n=1 Tax=Rhizoctonia solani TaxID=456999 RepID=A0A8H8T2E8_9AGAM|nr:Retrotransposable element Tf2 protein [Rhizoctonia solani]QRW26804.1 Retrotransposable element Tf2 protein [Rhizoctonia solani]
MIVDLPKDGSNNSILVIVDSFTKYVILVECSKKLKAPELADLFLRHVWKRYSMPKKTVSDQGQVFNNKFLKALYQRLGIDPHFSLAYHPQSDGQTERVNPTVKHFLRAYSGTNQKDWVKWLPMAEFAYNNAVHSLTGKSPFKALYGWEPSLTPSNIPTDVPEADNLATQMEAQWWEIESALRQSKTRMVAGETGEPLEFEIGEEAWLDAKNVKLKTLSPKLTKQQLGPFKDTAATTSSKDPVVMELLDEANKWEEEWELDAVIEQLEPSSKYSFEIGELDGIDLSSLVLLDLLSDDPVKGVNIGSAGKRKEVQKSGQENLVVSLLKFQF